MEKYHLFSSQKIELRLDTSKIKNKAPKAYSSPAKFIEQALSKDTLPEGLSEKLASKKVSKVATLEAPRYFAHFDDDAALEHKLERSDKFRELLYKRFLERKGGK